MPLVRNTETGNRYIEKINTGGDICLRNAVRSYYKTTATSGQTVFSIPFIYEPASYTLWVYVNGVKAEYVAAADYSAPANLKYDETDIQEVTFYGGLTLNDVVEFIVAGAYTGDEESGSGGIAPDLSLYKTRFGIDIGSGSPQNFNTNQPMGGYIFTGLGLGGTSASPDEDSVRFDQLGDYVNGLGVHYHVQLWDSAQTTPVITTVNNRVDISGAAGQVNIIGTTPQTNYTQSDGDDVQLSMESDYFYLRGRTGTDPYSEIMRVTAASGDVSFFSTVNLSGGSVEHQLKGVADATDQNDAVNLGQLETYRGIERIAPISIYSISKVSPPGLVADAITNTEALDNANTYTTVPSWANGLIFRVNLDIDQSSGVMGATDSHSLVLQFAYDNGSSWETVASVEMGGATANTNCVVWNDFNSIPYTTNNNYNFRFRWTYNKTTTLTNPIITVGVSLIGWYR